MCKRQVTLWDKVIFPARTRDTPQTPGKGHVTHCHTVLTTLLRLEQTCKQEPYGTPGKNPTAPWQLHKFHPRSHLPNDHHSSSQIVARTHNLQGHLKLFGSELVSHILLDIHRDVLSVFVYPQAKWKILYSICSLNITLIALRIVKCSWVVYPPRRRTQKRPSKWPPLLVNWLFRSIQLFLLRSMCREWNSYRMRHVFCSGVGSFYKLIRTGILSLSVKNC